MITFGLFASHDKEVPLEERNGKEEQTAAPEEEGEGGEEEEGEAADEDEDVEEAAEVTPTSIIINSVFPESSHHSWNAVPPPVCLFPERSIDSSCICWLSLSAVVS